VLNHIDAACVGKSTPILNIKGVKPLLITANGHGSRQSCRTDKYGFPNRHVPREKIHFGFQTGDIAKAVVTNLPPTLYIITQIQYYATNNQPRTPHTALFSSHHQTEYSFGGGFLEEV